VDQPRKQSVSIDARTGAEPVLADSPALRLVQVADDLQWQLASIARLGLCLVH
jgi:hypothetical protein